MKDDKRTKRFIFFVSGLLAFLTIAGLSFAYFTATIEEGSIFSTTGKAMNSNLRIRFTENQSGVSLSNTYPMPNQNGLELDPYTFTVTNEEKEQKITIAVVLEVLSSSTLSDELINISLNDNIQNLGMALTYSPSDETYRNAYKIDRFDLEPGESMTKELRTWINENGTIENAQNKTWSSRILIIPTVYEPSFIDEIIASSKGKVTDFSKEVTEEESGVYEMEDDYGTSYYFRGDYNLNNNILFAGESWRILRINGDKSLRIISQNATEFPVIEFDDVKYAGYMYGGKSGEPSTSKSQAQKNETDSPMKIALDSWYQYFIYDEDKQYISDTLFCNDRGIVTDLENTNGGIYADGFTSLGYGNNYTVFMAESRLGKQANKISPKFTCTQKNDSFTVNDTIKGNGALTYPIGSITADEAVAAGLTAESYNYPNFLPINSHTPFLTMSPNISRGKVTFFSMFATQLLSSEDLVEVSMIRPVINLKYDYIVNLHGSGADEDPYRAKDE